MIAQTNAAPAEEQAVIAGTVFRDPGFALPRAEVTLALKTPPEGAKAKKVKARKILTDGRGEFAFYVPVGKATYVLRVRAEGLEPQEKVVELSGGLERTDTYFTLKPATGAPEKDQAKEQKDDAQDISLFVRHCVDAAGVSAHE